MRVLTVNAGSTSLKLIVVRDGVAVERLATLDEALAGEPPDCVAHRVVHGGDRDRAVLVDAAVIDELDALRSLAPLHQPPALDALLRCLKAWPAVPNVACFDTAFHATLPAAASTYALPRDLRAEVRVYGFHGLAHAWAAAQVATIAPSARRVLVAHLGGGQSLCGVLGGRSVVTTMGFTPLDGLVMGTRSGSIDPGAVVWLAERHPDLDLGRVLNEESGLLGLCGSDDMRDVRRRADAGDPDARLAFDVWAHRLVTAAGGCIAALGGLDALAFSGGIGEHDRRARAALVDGLAWMGVAVADADEPSRDVLEITAPGSTARVVVVETREDLELAREAEALVA